MRFRKARGNKPAVVTLTEAEVVEACHRYLTSEGIGTSETCWLKINTNPVVKRRGKRVEFVSEVVDEQDVPNRFAV